VKEAFLASRPTWVGEQDRNLSKDRETNMRIPDLEAMAFDDLWRLYEEATRILAERIMAEKLDLERRLALLNRDRVGGNTRSAQADAMIGTAPTRKYPKVLPKYKNPEPPGETWSGRGKLPRWLVKALNAGRKLEEFRIGRPNQKPNKDKARRPRNY